MMSTFVMSINVVMVDVIERHVMMVPKEISDGDQKMDAWVKEAEWCMKIRRKGSDEWCMKIRGKGSSR